MKKRFLDKKGTGDTLGEYAIIIWEIMVFVVITLALLMYVRDLSEKTIFEKNFIARDTAMVVNTMYASPYTTVYLYPENTSMFTLRFNDQRVEVFDLDESEIGKIYPYADEESHQIEQELKGVETIRFNKKQALDFQGSFERSVECGGEYRVPSEFPCYPPESEFLDDDKLRWCNTNCEVALLGCDQFDSYPEPPEEGCNCGGNILEYGEGYCVNDKIRKICNEDHRCPESEPVCCDEVSYTDCLEEARLCNGDIIPQGSYACALGEIEKCCDCKGTFECYGFCCSEGWSPIPCGREEVCVLDHRFYNVGDTICGSPELSTRIRCKENWVCGCASDGSWTLNKQNCGAQGKVCVDGECV